MVQHRTLQATLLVVWVAASDLHAAEESTCSVNKGKETSTRAPPNTLNYNNILEKLFADNKPGATSACSFLRASAANEEELATESSTPLIITGDDIFTNEKWSNAKLKELIDVEHLHRSSSEHVMQVASPAHMATYGRDKSNWPWPASPQSLQSLLFAQQQQHKKKASTIGFDRGRLAKVYMEAGVYKTPTFWNSWQEQRNDSDDRHTLDIFSAGPAGAGLSFHQHG